MPNIKALGFQRFSCQSAPILRGRVLVLDARELLQEVIGVLQLQVFFWVALPLHGGHVDGGNHRGDVRRVLSGTELEVEGLHDFELIID